MAVFYIFDPNCKITRLQQLQGLATLRAPNTFHTQIFPDLLPLLEHSHWCKMVIQSMMSWLTCFLRSSIILWFSVFPLELHNILVSWWE